MSNKRETEYNIWVEVRVFGCTDELGHNGTMIDFGPKVDVLPTLAAARKARDGLLTDFSAVAARVNQIADNDRYGLFQVFACVEKHIIQDNGSDSHETLQDEERELGLFSTWQLARKFVQQIAPGSPNAW